MLITKFSGGAEERDTGVALLLRNARVTKAPVGAELARVLLEPPQRLEFNTLPHCGWEKSLCQAGD